jgi:hypothetical protein
MAAQPRNGGASCGANPFRVTTTAPAAAAAAPAAAATAASGWAVAAEAATANLQARETEEEGVLNLALSVHGS